MRFFPLLFRFVHGGGCVTFKWSPSFVIPSSKGITLYTHQRWCLNLKHSFLVIRNHKTAVCTGYHHVHCTGKQGTRPPVLSQAGIENNATGCGNLSMPSIHLDRLNTTQNQIKTNAKIKTVINNKQFSIGTINLQ